MDTIDNIIPNEVAYLRQYDEFKRFLEDEYEMPDKLVALLVRFLEQNNDKLSKWAQIKAFTEPNPSVIDHSESMFTELFY